MDICNKNLDESSTESESYDRAYYADEIRCFVPFCRKYRRDNPKGTFLCVPKALKEKWCQAVERSCPKRTLYVCDAHFDKEQDCFLGRGGCGKLHLKPTANLSLTTTYYEEPLVDQNQPSFITDVTKQTVENRVSTTATLVKQLGNIPCPKDPLYTGDIEQEDTSVDDENETKQQFNTPSTFQKKTSDRNQFTESSEMNESKDEKSGYVHNVSQTSNQDTCALYCNLLHHKLKSLNEITRDIAMMEIDRIMYILKQQDNNTMTSQRQLQSASSEQQRGTSDLSSNSFLKRKGINNEEYLIKRIRQDDALDHLFMSYAKTFRKLSSKKQVELKVQQAKMFADAELSDLQNDTKVGILDQNSAACSVYVSITELPADDIKEEPVFLQSE